MKKRGFIFLTGLIIISSIVSTRYFSLKKSTSYAINVGDTLGLIGKNNSINKALRQEIKAIEKEKAEKKIKIAREERKKKLEAERQKKLEKERQEKLERERQEKLERERQRKLEKVAYLTFDDGPSEKATPLVLDILKEYNIKATFFVLGSMAEQNPQILKRIHEEGHRIGNHSYSHKYNYIYKSVHNFFQDFKRSEEVLKSILGEDFNTNIIRFPGGSSGKQKAPMRIAAKDAGYTYYDWNALNGDAESLNLNKEHLLQRLKATTHNKKEAIILMHDTDSKMETVETLRSSIDYLIQQGFHFELLQ